MALHAELVLVVKLPEDEREYAEELMERLLVQLNQDDKPGEVNLALAYRKA